MCCCVGRAKPHRRLATIKVLKPRTTTSFVLTQAGPRDGLHTYRHAQDTAGASWYASYMACDLINTHKTNRLSLCCLTSWFGLVKQPWSSGIGMEASVEEKP